MAWGDHKRIKVARKLINASLNKANEGYKSADALLEKFKGKDSPIPGSKGQFGEGVPNAIAVGARDRILEADKELAKELRDIADIIENHKI